MSARRWWRTRPYSRLWVPYDRGLESTTCWWWRHVTQFVTGLVWLASGQRLSIAGEMRGVLLWGRRRANGTRPMAGLFLVAPDDEWRERLGRYRLRGRWIRWQ